MEKEIKNHQLGTEFFVHHRIVSIEEEIKSRMKSVDSVQNLLSSSLLSQNIKIKTFRTIILPTVMCGCETWLLTLKEEHKPRVIEKRMLRKIFGAKKGEVTRDWIKLHNEELTDLYSSPNIILVIKS